MSIDYLEFKNHLEHSYLEHASKAGMPTNIKKDQRTQIKKEIVRKIDAYLNSSKFTDIRSRGSFLTNEIKNMPGGGSIAQREMRKASLKGEASDKEAKKKAYDDLMTYIRKYSGSSAYANLFNQDEVELIYQLGSTHWGTARPYAEKLKKSLSHDNLEHASIAGAPSRLRSKMQNAIYKKTGYQSKGSYAGAPINVKQTTADQNKAVANARFSANIKSAIEACNRDAAEAQSVYVEATTRINNIVSRNRGEVNSIIRSVNEYNENVRNIRNQTITKKSTFSTVANGKLYQVVRDEQVPVDANRQFISFSAGAQKISTNKYVYKPKMLLIDHDPGTYKEV